MTFAGALPTGASLPLNSASAGRSAFSIKPADDIVENGDVLVGEYVSAPLMNRSVTPRSMVRCCELDARCSVASSSAINRRDSDIMIGLS